MSINIDLTNEQIYKIICAELHRTIQDIENDNGNDNLIFEKNRKGLLKALKRIKLFYCGDDNSSLIKSEIYTNCKHCKCGNH
jgi:hypothetical protein